MYTILPESSVLMPTRSKMSTTTHLDDRDRRALGGWRFLWISTIVCYFLYGAAGGDLGVPWGPLLGVAIGVVIAGRVWVVNGSRWFYYWQTCIYAGVLLTVGQGILIINNVVTILALLPLMASIASVLISWYLMFRPERPKRLQR